MVLTVRDGESVPPAVEQLWQTETFDRIKLEPLATSDIESLLSATLGGPVDPEVPRRLWELTRGNPLYLRNIVEREVADGRLAQQYGCWAWTAGPVIPNDLAESIDLRIRTLPIGVIDVIDALAVGEPIELGALTRITDRAAVDSAAAHGFITIEGDSSGTEARVAHPLYGEVRRIRAAPTRLRRLRGRVAAELAASDRPNDMRVVVRRAALSLDSDLPPDTDLLIRGAQGAVWLPILRWQIDSLMLRSAREAEWRRISFAPMRSRGSAAPKNPTPYSQAFPPRASAPLITPVSRSFAPPTGCFRSRIRPAPSATSSRPRHSYQQPDGPPSMPSSRCIRRRWACPSKPGNGRKALHSVNYQRSSRR